MVQTGRVLFDTKYTTAIIIDASDRPFFVPIKYVVGDYFLAEIEKQVYVFSLVGARIFTKRQTATRSFRFTLYETSHFRPISPKANKELEIILERNHLPKVDGMLFTVLKMLGKREKDSKNTTLDAPHRLMDLIAEITKDENRYTQDVKNIKEYLDHLKVEEIVTPVRKMADFIEAEILETNAGFYGEIISRFKRTDIEHKIIMNKPVKTSKHLFKWIAVIMLVALVAAAALLLFGGGNMGGPPDLSHLIPGFSGLTAPGASSVADFQKLYPDPYLAKKAVDEGKLNENQIPPELRNLVKGAKPPVVTPIPSPTDQKIELTP